MTDHPTSIRDLPGRDYRSAISPSEILIERRVPAEVDAMRTPAGARRRTYNDLSVPQRHLFDAQLAAYRAAVVLVREIDTYLAIGQYTPVVERERFNASIGDLGREWSERRWDLMNERMRQR